jgi:hypothetical protein
VAQTNRNDTIASITASLKLCRNGFEVVLNVEEIAYHRVNVRQGQIVIA